MAKPITVKYRDLHPEIKQKVRDVLDERKGRIALTALGALSGAGIGGMGRIVIFPFENLTVSENDWGSVPRYAAVGAAVTALSGYKAESTQVRKFTSKTGEVMRAVNTVDAKGKIKVGDVRGTHPFAFVNRKGDVVLVPNTRYQRAVAAAQKTFLRHVIPGRYRVKV